MDQHQDPPRAVHSDHDCEPDENSEGAESDSSEEPPYSVQELAAVFIDFYKFLATLHYDPADLKMPPPEGWDTAVLPPAIVSSKSEEVVALVKIMPYFKKNERSTHVHYKSKLIDYTDPEQHRHAKSYDEMIQGTLGEPGDDDKPWEYTRLITIAMGYESGGTTLILDVFRGEITEDIVRMITCGPEDVRNFFEDLKEKFRSLQLIPCPGREVGDMEVPELDRVIAEDEIRAQTEEWGTHLDWQFVRQVYRQYGWPNDFRRQEAIEFMDGFMARNKHLRGEWEPARH